MRKKNPYFYGLLPYRGAGGSARVVKKPYCFFEIVIFQRACSIILGPPKHVFHLVWSVLGISAAIRTALKGALHDCSGDPLAPSNGQFMTKVDHYNRIKQIIFSMEPSVKFVFTIIDPISKRFRGRFLISQSRT